MCKVTSYIDSGNFGNLYDLVCSQFQYFDREIYWKKASEIHFKQYATWERLDGAANGDKGCVGTNLICFHLHLNLSKKTSPYSIIKDIREFFAMKFGSDIFENSQTYHNWAKQFPNERFEFVSHNYQNLIK